jgi:hypothetical protein
LWFVVAVDPNELARSEVECLDQETGDTAQILNLIIGTGGLAADDFDRLVSFAYGDYIESRFATILVRRLSDKPRIREIEERYGWNFTQAAAPNVQGVSPRERTRLYTLAIRVRRQVAVIPFGVPKGFAPPSLN